MVTNRALKRDKFVECMKLPAMRLLAMESCSGAHHWACKLIGQGLDARIIAEHLVTPLVWGRSIFCGRVAPFQAKSPLWSPTEN